MNTTNIPVKPLTVTPLVDIASTLAPVSTAEPPLSKASVAKKQFNDNKSNTNEVLVTTERDYSEYEIARKTANTLDEFVQNSSKDVVLGPSSAGGGGFGMAWNKPKPAATTTPTVTMGSSGGNDSNNSGNTMTSGSSFNRNNYNAQTTTAGKSFSAASTNTNFMSRGGSNNAQEQPKQVTLAKKTDSVSSTGNGGTWVSTSRDTSASSISRDQHLISLLSQSSTTTIPPSKSNGSAKKQDYSEDEIARKAANTLDEFVQNANLTEALKDLEEFEPADPNQYRLFVEQLITVVLERNDIARASLDTLLFNALKHGKLSQTHVVAGLHTMLEIAEDMQVDVPLYKHYLSQVVAPLISDELDNPVQILHEACAGVVSEQRLCNDIVVEVFKSAAARLGESLVCGLIKKADVTLRKMLGSYSTDTEFDEYVSKSKLEWAVNTANAVVPERHERTLSSSGSPLDAYEKKLMDILATSGADNAVVEERITKQFSAADLQTKLFVRALVISVWRSCYSEKLDSAAFKQRSSLLNKYIGKREEMELEALFAIQALYHRLNHQPGVIRLLFDLMYGEDIIREKVFYLWRNDVREEGHQISALATKGFFEWFEHPEDQW